MSHITVVSIVTKLWSGWLGFKSRQEQVTIVFSITFKLVLGPTRFIFIGHQDLLLTVIKWPVCDVYYSPLSNAEVKNESRDRAKFIFYLLHFYVPGIHTVNCKQPVSYDNRLCIFWNIYVVHYFVS